MTSEVRILTSQQNRGKSTSPRRVNCAKQSQFPGAEKHVNHFLGKELEKNQCRGGFCKTKPISTAEPGESAWKWLLRAV